MRKRTAVVLAAALVSGLSLVSPAQASHSWGGYHWARKTNPFTLKLGDNLTGTAWKPRLVQASGDWNTLGTTPLTTSIVPGTSNKRCSMVAGTTQVCNGRYGSNGWLGLASINVTGGTHITQGTAKLNDTYFDTSTYNNVNEREHVMCQEVAHTFGLDHQSTNGSSLNTCMDYFSNTGATAGSTASTTPNQHDFDELATIYTHTTDSTTTVAATPAASADQVGNDRSTWGREVARGARGEYSVFVRDFGGDQQVITYVTWAGDGAAVQESGTTAR